MVCVENFMVGMYLVIIINGECIIIEFYELIQLDSIFLKMMMVMFLCLDVEDGELEVLVLGGIFGYDYLWGNGFIIFWCVNLGVGVYFIIVIDENGCQLLDIIQLFVFEFLFVQFDLLVEISCLGEIDGLICVVGSGGIVFYQFVWLDGSIVF